MSTVHPIYICVCFNTCRSISPRQKELMEEFAEEEKTRLEAGETKCEAHGFTQTVRETVDRIKKFLNKKKADEK